MSSRKWRKQLASEPASFHRRHGSKPPGKAILIVTEGKVTERIYFEALKRKLALATVEISIVPGGFGDPRRLAEYALEEQAERVAQFKSGRLSFSKAAKFDEIWIVFDTDVPVQHGRYADGVAFAKSKKIKIADSTPCFEFWLLLHKTYTTAPMPKCAEVIPRLSEALGRKYAKDAEESKELIPPLLDGLASAREGAKRVRAHHARSGTPHPANPSTAVDRLTDALDPPSKSGSKRTKGS